MRTGDSFIGSVEGTFENCHTSKVGWRVDGVERKGEWDLWSLVTDPIPTIDYNACFTNIKEPDECRYYIIISILDID